MVNGEKAVHLFTICDLLFTLSHVRQHQSHTNRLFLTYEGRRTFAEVVPAHEALIDERLSVLSEEEQKQLFELLRRLDRALE